VTPAAEQGNIHHL